MRKVYLGPATNAFDLDKLLFNKLNLPSIAFVARSNSGKSSLVNALLGGGNHAIVSKTPGRTQLAHAYQGNGFILIDLPGYGYSKDTRNIMTMSNTIFEIAIKRENDLVLVLTDVKREGYTIEDEYMVQNLKDHEVPFKNVFTKLDTVTYEGYLKADLQIPSAFPTSSKRNIGISELKRYLQNLRKNKANEEEEEDDMDFFSKKIKSQPKDKLFSEKERD